MVPGLLAVAAALGFSILNIILGGQALSSIANMSWTCVVLRATQTLISQIFISVGIVIISVISLFVSKCRLYMYCF